MKNNFNVKEKKFPCEIQFSIKNIEMEQGAIKIFINNHYKKHIEIIRSLISLHIKLNGYLFKEAELKQRLGLSYDENIVMNNAILNHFYLPLSILDLLENSYYGSARVLLRQSYEMLIIAKYCEYKTNARLRWENKKEIKMGDILKFIEKNKPSENLRKLWRELCKCTHATSFSQQYIRLPYHSNKKKIVDEIEKWANATNLSKNMSYTFDLLFVVLMMLFHLDNKFHSKVKSIYSSNDDPFGFHGKIKEAKNEIKMLEKEYFDMLEDKFVDKEGVKRLKKIIFEYRQNWI